jgi:DNA-binding IclR family transcriptional regulator
MTDTPNNSQAATKVIRIVDALHEETELGVTELGSRIGLSKGGVHKYLKSMEQRGWVENNGGKYSLTLRFLTIGGTVREQHIDNQIIDEKVQDLADETGMTAGFGVQLNGVVFTHLEYSLNSMRQILPLGAQLPLHTNATGKAILAQKSEETIRELANQSGLESFTDETITDIDSLLEEINTVRERGYAVMIDERIESWSGAASAVEYPDRDLTCALSIGGPTRTLTQERIDDELSEAILRNASELEIMLR